MTKILLIEDDLELAENIELWFARSGDTLDLVADGESGAYRLANGNYDMVILDVDLPKKDGFSLCREYRENGGKIPIIMLTGKAASPHKVQGLDAGADDYIAKPFSLHELSARIRAVLRRSAGQSTDKISYGSLTINFTDKQAFQDSRLLKLRPREFALLEFFARHPNQVFSTEALLQRVWSDESESSIEAVRSCLRVVRAQLGTDHCTQFETVHGFGYRLKASDLSASAPPESDFDCDTLA